MSFQREYGAQIIIYNFDWKHKPINLIFLPDIQNACPTLIGRMYLLKYVFVDFGGYDFIVYHAHKRELYVYFSMYILPLSMALYSLIKYLFLLMILVACIVKFTPA